MRKFSIKKAAELIGVDTTTLRRWEKENKITAYRLPSGHRRYTEAEILRIVGQATKSEEKPKVAIYARVSSQKQLDSGNLERQKERLISYARKKNYVIIETFAEVASGLNEKRRKLKKLLNLVADKKIDIVLIEFQDRLARFGFRYLEKYINDFGVSLEIVNGTEPKTLQEELVQDLIAIMSSFSAKLYGSRSKHFKKKVLLAIEECSTPSKAK